MSEQTDVHTGALQGQELDLNPVVRRAAVVSEAIPDSLATQTASLELLPHPDRAEDGPLLLGLLLNNQNNNNLAASGAAPLRGSNTIPESLAAQTAAIELLSSPDQFEQPEPPGLLLASVNNNNVVAQAIPDSLATQTAALELTPSKNDTKYGDGILRLWGALADPTPSMEAHQLQSWRENGFLEIPGVLPKAVLSKLLQSTRETIEELIKGGDNVRVHSISDGNKQQPYISPCGRVMASVEKEVSGHHPMTPLQRISRLGCGIHRILPAFRSITFSAFHQQIAHQLGFVDPRITQSQIVTKSSVVGPRIVPHQDGCTVFTNPASCVTFWYTLEDTTVNNGCLALAPGSHREEPLRRRCRRDETGRANFVDLETPVYAKVDGVDESTRAQRAEDGSYIYQNLVVKAGTLILMHGNLMHRSEANRSERSRVAYVFGVVEGSLEWLPDSYLQPYEGETEFEKLIPLA